jgi:O-antigen ligase
VRGGAIPVLVWGTILLVLAAGNWIWDDKPVNSGAATAAVVIIYSFGVALWLNRREAIRRGPPEPRPETETVPQSSLAAVLIGLSVATVLFGLAWSNFLVYFGAGLLIVSLGRLAGELRSEAASRRENERP